MQFDLFCRVISITLPLDRTSLNTLPKRNQLKFRIDVSESDRKELLNSFEKILRSNFWSEGPYVKEFEEAFGSSVGLKAVATSSWAGAALATFEYFNVRNSVVLMPSNTFMATPLAAMQAGAHVQFVDCNRNDLCVSAEDLESKIREFKPKMLVLVHIGGHLAFETETIAEICRKQGVILVEDCAHSHGALYKGKRAGEFGHAGLYSFYATKTLTSGEGGALVTGDSKLETFARKYINYGKPDFEIHGLNFRMNEFTAAVALWHTKKLPQIVEWKNQKAKELDKSFSNRLKLPPQMVSGYYKYIVFEPIPNSTGKVYEQPCHQFLKRPYSLPNTEWVSHNHWCVPLFYKGDDPVA